MTGAQHDAEQEGYQGAQEGNAPGMLSQNLLGNLQHELEPARGLQHGRAAHHRQDYQHDVHRGVSHGHSEHKDLDHETDSGYQSETDAPESAADVQHEQHKNKFRYQHKFSFPVMLSGKPDPGCQSRISGPVL